MYSELSFDDAYELSMNGPDYSIKALYSDNYTRANGGAPEFGDDDGTADFAEEALVFDVVELEEPKEKEVIKERQVPRRVVAGVGSVLAKRSTMFIGGRDQSIEDIALPDTESAAA